MIDMFAPLFSNKRWKNITINRREYNQWRRQAVIDVLQGKKLAESFCEHFDLTDYILLYGPAENVEGYIQKHYLR